MANRTCPKCGADLIKSNGGWYCPAFCGYDVRSAEEKHKFLIANLPDIKKDCLSIGVQRASKKWKISMDALYKTPEIHRALLMKKVEMLDNLDGNGASEDNGATPHLPEFSNEWTPEIQLKWLEIWEKIKI